MGDKLIGRKLGDYVLVKTLNQGGMSQLYIGEDPRLGRLVAVKVMIPDYGRNNELIERFEREARAIAHLEHDNIISIYQYGKQEDLYFIAMPYIQGSDLATELRHYQEHGEIIPVARCLALLGQIADALDYSHQRGIVHRDVKPSNILIYNHTSAKAVLTDFGLVSWQEEMTLGTAFGTPRYISPEQATNSRSAVSQSDIYSLAVIVYEALTGQPLFNGFSPMEIALSHITEQPIPPRAHNPDIPADAQIDILKALQKDPTQRHATAREFIDSLKQAYHLDASAPILRVSSSDLSAVPSKRANSLRLFMSYSSKDRQRAMELSQRLEGMGYDIWMDDKLNGGSNWWDEIIKQIQNCDVMILALSTQYMQSVPCQKEYAYAYKLKKHLLPVQIEDFNYLILPRALAEIQLVNLLHDEEKALKDIATILGDVTIVARPRTLPTYPHVPLSELHKMAELAMQANPLTSDEEHQFLASMKHHLGKSSYEQDAAKQIIRMFLSSRETISDVLAQELRQLVEM